MHLHNNMIVIALGFLLLLSISARAQDREPKGTYEYDEYGCPIKSKSYDRLLNLTVTLN